MRPRRDIGTMAGVIDPGPLWDFDDPAASELRFREMAAAAKSPEREAWLTQAARSLGLQERFAEGHALLDDLAVRNDDVAIRTALERGRLVRSAGDAAGARPLFEEAARAARDHGQDELLVDALHMLALGTDPEDQVAAHEAALAVARTSGDQRARDWDASLLNNLAMAYADAGDHAAALAAFEEALAARERIGDEARTRVARWMVAWSLRLLGRSEEALSQQLTLQADLLADGEVDPFVEEEIALLEGEDLSD